MRKAALFFLLLPAFALVLNSCNNSKKKTEENKEMKDTTKPENTMMPIDTTHMGDTNDTTGKGEQVPPPPK